MNTKYGIIVILLLATFVSAIADPQVLCQARPEPVQPQSNLCCSWPYIHFKDTRDPWVVLYDWALPLNISLLIHVYGSTPTDSNWNPQLDVYPWPKGDGQIELMDLFVICLHFGET